MGVLLVIWLISAGVGLAIGSSKGRPVAGLLLGFFLGIIGVIIIACMGRTPEAEARHNQQVIAATRAMGGSAVSLPGPAQGGAYPLRRCPHCAEEIQPAAKVCRYCGRDVEPIPVPVAAPVEGWYPDPSARYPDRYWNGAAWTEWVRDQPGGTRSSDPQPWTAAWQ